MASKKNGKKPEPKAKKSESRARGGFKASRHGDGKHHHEEAVVDGKSEDVAEHGSSIPGASHSAGACRAIPQALILRAPAAMG